MIIIHDVSVYGRGRNLDKAVEIFNKAQGLGGPLDEKICTNMICRYGKAGLHFSLTTIHSILNICIAKIQCFF